MSKQIPTNKHINQPTNQSTNQPQDKQINKLTKEQTKEQTNKHMKVQFSFALLHILVSSTCVSLLSLTHK